MTFDVAANATAGDIEVTANNTCGSSTASTQAVTLNDPVAITTGPQGVTACSGTDITLTAAATGSATLSYQWKQGTTNVGTDAASLSITGLDATKTGNYTVEVTNGCGTATSAQAVVALNTALTIDTDPQAITDCEGQAGNLTVAATGSGTLSYQWKEGATNVGTDASTLSFSPLALADGGTYSVDVTDECTTVSSTSAVVTVNEGITITTQPTGTGGCVGSSTSMSVVATGTATISYQWKQDGSNVGTDAATLSFPSLASSDAGNYTVEVTNSCGTVTSDVAALAITLNETPAVTLGSDVASLCEGGTVELTAGAQGGGSAPTFTFSETGLGTIGTAGQTGNIETTPALSNTGTAAVTLTFEVEMLSNSSCIATGAANPVTAQVSVDIDPQAETATINESDQTLCTDGMSLTAAAISTDQTGTWSKGTGTSGSIDGSGIVTGLAKGETVEFIYTVTTPLGLCTESTDNINLFRAGDMTNPAPVASQTTSICSDEAAPTLTGLTLQTGETGVWTATAPATITGGQTGNLQLGANVFTYEISNPVSGCDPVTQDVTITVIDAPTVTMVTPTADPALVGTASTNLEVTDLGSPAYVTNWTINTGQGTLGTPNAVTTTLDDLDATSSTTNITVSIVDENGVCTAATNSFDVTRVAQTVPDLGADITICEQTTYPLEIDIPSSIIGGIETESLLQNAGGAATINATTRKIEVTALTAAGSPYTIEYEVANNINGPSASSLQIFVDEFPSQVSFTVDPIVTCQSQVNLTAETPLPATSVGTWSISSEPATQTASIVATELNSPTGLVTGLIQGQTTLDWSVVNGTCSATPITLTIDQVGEITNPTISINGTDVTGTTHQMCLADAALAIQANTTLKATETGTWTSTFTGTTANQSYSPSSTGVETITWEISTTVTGCTNAQKSIAITTLDVPDVTGIVATLADGCEGTDVAASVPTIPDASSYSWLNEVGSVIKSQSGQSATLTLVADDVTTTASVEVVGTNICGASTPVVASNTIDLEPNATPVINGDAVVCGSKNYTYDQPSPTADATSWRWEWNGDDRGTGATLSLGSSDLTGTSGVINLVPINACGEGPAGTTNVTIQTPDVPKVALNFAGTTSDGKACEDEEGLDVEVDLTIANGGSGATYQYFVGTQSQGAAGSNTSLTIAQGDWKDGDLITVQMTPDVATGCFTGTGDPVTSTAIQVEGFNIPAPLLESDKSVVCAGTGTITLTLTKNDAKGDVVDYWEKDNSQVLGFTSSVYTATSSTDRGDYIVTVSNPECATPAQTTVESIMLYEQPRISPYAFVNPLTNRLVVYIDDAGASVNPTYPVIVTGLSQDIGITDDYRWNSTTLSIEQGQADFSFNAEGETEGDEYISLVVSNGVAGAVCVDSLGFNIAVSLPLDVPNAFSPNGDGINDKWVIQGMNDFPDAQMTIFNRWGGKLYERFGGYSADAAWDGEGYPVGTYYYILKLNKTAKLEGEDDVVRGAVTITK